MSSLRNAVARRPHRERAQPLERRRLGLLEKHKDYSQRAKDYNKKKQQIKSLREKAADRNEDEFYFGMMSRNGAGSRLLTGKSWKGTLEGDRGNKAMSVEAVRLLKTQDLGYIRTMRQVIAKEVTRLEQQLVMARGPDAEADDDEVAPRKILFMDDEEEREATMLETLEAEQEQEQDGNGKSASGERNVAKIQRKLENAKDKQNALNEAEAALDTQRAKMAKTATSGGETRSGKKIKVKTRKR